MNLLLGLLVLSACGQDQVERASPELHVFYLHGRIIELQGIKAVSPDFGPYHYTAILDSFRMPGIKVHHEVRIADIDFFEFCERTSHQIDSLLTSGVSAEQIAVVGASKGAVMAMYISHFNRAPIHYVLLGANNDYIESTYDWQLHGHILGIYEASDQLAGKNYQFWKDRSTESLSFEQLELNTGLGHGFFYRPIPDWLNPTLRWIKYDTPN